MNRTEWELLHAKKRLSSSKKDVYRAYKEAQQDERVGDPEELREAHRLIREAESILKAFYTGEEH